MPHLPIIRVGKALIDQQQQWILKYSKESGLHPHAEKIPDIKWSRKNQCPCIPATHHNLLMVISYLKPYAHFDTSEINGSIINAATNREGHFFPLSQETLDHIQEVKDYMEQIRYSPSTIKTYVSFITQFFAHHPELKWNEISKDTILRYNHAHFIKNKLSYSSQNQWISAIKVYLYVHNLMDGKELIDIERPNKPQSLPDILSMDEVKKIFLSIRNVKHRALLMLIYSGGLRVGEAMNLHIEDIRSDENLIYIRRAKGNKDRRVPLAKTILHLLRQYYIIEKPRKYLFEGKPGKPYTASSTRKVFKRALKRCGITRKITLHTLRHSYATHLTNRGVNIQYLQEILGHNSPKTTMLYTHLSGKDIKHIKNPLDDMQL